MYNKSKMSKPLYSKVLLILTDKLKNLNLKTINMIKVDINIDKNPKKVVAF